LPPEDPTLWLWPDFGFLRPTRYAAGQFHPRGDHDAAHLGQPGFGRQAGRRGSDCFRGRHRGGQTDVRPGKPSRLAAPTPFSRSKWATAAARTAGGVVFDPEPKTLTFNVAPVVHDASYQVARRAAHQTLPRTHLTLASQPGDPVGQGATYEVRADDGQFVAIALPGASELPAPLGEDVGLVFAAPSNSPLTPDYLAANAASTGDAPFLKVGELPDGPSVVSGRSL